MKNWQIAVFILILGADIFMIINGMSRTITKPLILLSLIIFTLSTLGGSWKDHFLFLLGMIFAWLGDVLLLGDGNLFFILGLASFLTMQLIYSYVFFRQKAIGIHNRMKQFFAVIALSILFILFLLPKVETEMQVPVIVYFLSIVLMTVLAILRWKVKGYYFVLVGALLFMFSDGLLGLNKFGDPIKYAGIGVMLSYGLAQLFICHGYLIGRSK